MRRPPTSALLLAAAVLLCPSLAAAGDAASRYVIELESASLVAAAMADPERFSRLEDGRIDLGGDGAGEKLAALDAEHEAFAEALAGIAPGSRVDWSYRVLFNGLVASGIDPEQVARVPGVKRVRPTDGVEYRASLDTSLEVVGAGGAWADLGGVENAGEGVRIAVIDSGIDFDHPFFDDAGYEALEGYPLGDLQLANAKIVGARAYFRPDDPVDPERDEATPADRLGHGSFVAGIAAGNSDTELDLGAQVFRVGGVAPRARLMAYKVLYGAGSGREGAAEPEILAALEDAVIDGAHVIACAFEAPDLLGPDASTAVAFRAVADAGVVLVAPAGNQGGGRGSLSYPGTLGRVLTAGATLSGRGLAGWLDVVTPASPPETLVGMVAVRGRISPDYGGVIGPVPIVLASVAGEGLSDDGCNPFPTGVFEGAVALIPRGECTFSTKAVNAEASGAVAVVVANDFDDALPFAMAGDPVEVPAAMLGEREGNRLIEWVREHPETEVVLEDGLAWYPRESETDQVWYESGRGPTDAVLIKPELLAPGGAQILSAGTGEDGHRVSAGTSAAVAHVAGAAALVRQLRPGWSGDQVKAALIGSATEGARSSSLPPLGMGAGRLDLAAATALETVASPAVLALGETAPGGELELHVTLSGEEAAGELEASWEMRLGGGLPVHEPKEGELVSLAEGFTVRVDTASDDPPREYAGRLLLSEAGGGPTVLALPYHYRVTEPFTEDLLLLDMTYLPEENSHFVDLYRELAEEAGLEAVVYRSASGEPAPPLAELMSYRVVLAFTGDDQTSHLAAPALTALDHLASYLRKGGRLIVAGQGPFRGSTHRRFSQLAGGFTSDRLPLGEPDGGLPSPDETLAAEEAGGRGLLDGPVDLGGLDDGLGALGLLGDIEPLRGAELPTLWAEPLLVVGGDEGDLAARVGVVFDPFPGVGRHRESDVLSHRVVFLGFGFERVSLAGEGGTGRQRLFDKLYEWVGDRLEIEITTETLVREALVSVEDTRGRAVVYEYDMGDGTPVVASGSSAHHHEYDELGSYQVTVTARSLMGVVARGEVELELEPAADAAPADEVTADDPDGEDSRSNDCGCRQVGAGRGSSVRLIEELWHALGI